MLRRLHLSLSQPSPLQPLMHIFSPNLLARSLNRPPSAIPILALTGSSSPRRCNLSLRLTHADAYRVFSMYSSLLTWDPSADLVLVYRFLLGLGELPFPDLGKTAGRCPRLLVSSVKDTHPRY